MGEMTATKEQERKALVEIREIVDGLGENSHVAAAFDGCFGIAGENIRYDQMCSMKEKVEAAEKQAGFYVNLANERYKLIEELMKRNDELKKENAQLVKKNVQLNRENAQIVKENAQIVAEIEKLDKKIQHNGNEIEKLGKDIKELLSGLGVEEACKGE
jgi:predicted RNase H-like nuclease (RuvC/YqgF family)